MSSGPQTRHETARRAVAVPRAAALDQAPVAFAKDGISEHVKKRGMKLAYGLIDGFGGPRRK